MHSSYSDELNSTLLQYYEDLHLEDKGNNLSSRETFYQLSPWELRNIQTSILEEVSHDSLSQQSCSNHDC